MTKYIKWIRAVLLFPIIMIFMDVIAANAQSSPHYIMAFDVFSQAGQLSSSQNYQLRDCLGQPSATGESNNGLVLLNPGFMGWRPWPAVLAFNFTPGWSWISFNVKPDDPAMEQVFAGMLHLVICVNGAGQFYVPGVVNSIGNLDVRQGYKVYFDGPEQLEFTGSWVPSHTPIDLSAGWNFISYLAAAGLDAETALQTILPDLGIVKDDTGTFFVPGVINTLGQMKAQEGYKVYMKRAATLVYPLIAAGPGSTRNLAKVLSQN